MHTAHRRECFCLALLVVLTAACAGSQPPVRQTAPDSSAIMALFNLPAPSTLLARDGRQASVTNGPLCKTGDAFDASLPRRFVSPETCLAKFTPYWTPGDSFIETAYCCYRFDLTGYADAVQLAYSFAVSPAKSGLVYLGVANFVKDAWDWYAAPLPGVVPLADAAPYCISGTDEMLVAVVCIGEEGIDLANIRIGNIPPQATFTADTLLGIPGEVVHFDAAGSSDEDGQIAKYQWDPEGDGTYIPILFGSGSPTKTITYSQPGLWHPTLKVTDDSGATDTYSETLNITMGNKYQGVLDDGLEAGWKLSAAVLADNCPAVAYMMASGLYYIYALSPEALNWSGRIAVDSNCHDSPSLAVIAGRPAIAYQSGGNDLGYVRASNASGSSWPVPKIAVFKDADYLIGCEPSLAEVGGLPAIAYYDLEQLYGGVTWYVRADDANGTTWQPHKHVSPGGTQTGSPALAVINGVPMITYVAAIEVNPFQMDLSVANDALGDAWNPALIAVGAGAPVASQHTLMVAGGKPAVGYFDYADGTLRFARATQTTGETWADPVPVAVSVETYGAFSFAVIHGLPCCAYGVADGGLYYVIAKNSIGSLWNEPILVDAAANAYNVSLVSVYDLPAIAFYDGYNRELGFVIYI